MKRRVWQHLAVLAVTVVCLVFTTIAWHYDLATSQRIGDLEFERGAHRIEQAVQERFRHLETMVRAAQGLVEANDTLDAARWNVFTDRMRLKSGEGGVVGLAYFRPGGDAFRQDGRDEVFLVAPQEWTVVREVADTPSVREVLDNVRRGDGLVLSGRFEVSPTRGDVPVSADRVLVAPVRHSASEAPPGVVVLGLALDPLLDSVLGRSVTDGYAISIAEGAEDAEPFYINGAADAVEVLKGQREGRVRLGGRWCSAVVLGG